MRNLLRGLIKLMLLAGLGYVVYRLISEIEAADDPVVTPAEEALRSVTRAADNGDGTTTGGRREGAGTSPGGADRPSSSPATQKPAAVRSIGVGEVPEEARRWVEPGDDGSCPTSHPVKAKLESGIFHVPGGRHYERTQADRCYRDAEAAEADDLRQSKQ